MKLSSSLLIESSIRLYEVFPDKLKKRIADSYLHFSPYVDGNPGAAGANLLWLCGNSIRIGCVAGDEKTGEIRRKIVTVCVSDSNRGRRLLRRRFVYSAYIQSGTAAVTAFL